MYFFGALLLAALATLVTAQQNPFNIPPGGYTNVQAGASLDLSWQPTTGGTITLVLRSGDATNLQAGTEIVSNAPNSGTYTWPIPSSLTKGFAYTVQIISDHGDINYTPYFSIDSSNTVPSSTSVVATGAPTGGAGAPPALPESLRAAQSSLVGTATGMGSGTASATGASKTGGAVGREAVGRGVLVGGVVGAVGLVL